MGRCEVKNGDRIQVDSRFKLLKSCSVFHEISEKILYLSETSASFWMYSDEDLIIDL